MALGPAQKAELIDAIYVKLGVPAAAEHCHLKLRDVLTEMDDDEDFGAAVEQAMAHLTPLAEQELFRRAVHGTENYVVNQGRVVFLTNSDGISKPLIEKKYSDGLLTKFLEARKKDVFGAKVEVAHKHSGFIAVPVMSMEEIQNMLDSPGDEVTFIDASYQEIVGQRPLAVADADVEADWPPQSADSEPRASQAVIQERVRALTTPRQEPELIDFDPRDDAMEFVMDRLEDEPDFEFVTAEIEDTAEELKTFDDDDEPDFGV
jgi:hypothetical protein